MPITQFLERNAEQWPNDVALVELNPDIKVPRLTTWKEYELIQPLHEVASRQEITWAVFNEKANRVANMLIARGIVKGDKVAILLMNCLDWLPIYFGILKTGAIAVPLNFRYSADEIEYCVKLGDRRQHIPQKTSSVRWTRMPLLCRGFRLPDSKLFQYCS